MGSTSISDEQSISTSVSDKEVDTTTTTTKDVTVNYKYGKAKLPLLRVLKNFGKTFGKKKVSSS